MENKDYRASIKVVGTVMADTKLILKKYIELMDMELLKKEVIQNNLILKNSKRRAATVFYEVRKRYLQDQIEGYSETGFIYFLKNIHADSIVNLILYYHLCKEERIIYEYIADIVHEKFNKGHLGISSEETKEFILGLAQNDENVSKWSESTVNDVRSGMMGVLKEFGFINSRKRPLFKKVFVQSIVFYYVLYKNRDSIHNINDIYICRDFNLFLMTESDMKILIDEAYRNGVLDFYGEDEIRYIYKDIKEIVDGYVDGKIH